MTKAFIVKRSDRSADKTVLVGQTVYACRGYDYGVARDDTRASGVEHLSVTRKADGDYPCFTIPVADIEEVEA